MLNSCVPSDVFPEHAPCLSTDLLNRHNHLHGIETVQAEIIVEVRLAVQLQGVSYCATCCCVYICTLEVSVTYSRVSQRPHMPSKRHYLVKVLQQIHYPALDLILCETGR
jgi:hypothetical protein